VVILFVAVITRKNPGTARHIPSIFGATAVVGSTAPALE
jgi:hypothetical protein